MESERGSVSKFRKFRKDLLIEAVLFLVMLGYFLAAESHSVGENLNMTVVGAAIIAVWTCWTLATARDGLEWVAARVRRRVV
ncbi:hypothetical protein SAMN04487963_0732 [Marinobacter zhejiangensis]|uniref:Uncharacterized protein n=2 Tax=Marinobacter zhejiangensis TaxID=488535 RepID=A0A1I4LY86_9GAMM|nr:hypothetical protein SAMN04487963_0732 [Marinobacter zhejiangensis]